MFLRKTTENRGCTPVQAAKIGQEEKRTERGGEALLT